MYWEAIKVVHNSVAELARITLATPGLADDDGGGNWKISRAAETQPYMVVPSFPLPRFLLSLRQTEKLESLSHQ
jgi:hypothetical protein